MVDTKRRNMKPFGWGELSKEYNPLSQPSIQKYIKNKFHLDHLTKQPHSLEVTKICFESKTVSSELKQALSNILGPQGFSTDHELIAAYSGGRSYRDLVEKRSLSLSRSFDVILSPQTGEQIVALLKLCNQYKIALVPFAGGTSVVGGLDPIKLSSHSYCACLDLTSLNRILEFDEISQLVTVEPGIYGIELEQYLNQKGFTLGHFPQSFEFITIGGCIAARSSGQNSIFYGNMAKLVESITIATPSGIISTPKTPNHACGPDINQVIIGSEGIFGVITRCTLKVHPKPKVQHYEGYLFKTVYEASEAARQLAQSEIRPAMIRVSDGNETEASLMLASGKSHFFKKWIRQQVMRQWSKQGFQVGSVSMMILGFEGSQDFVSFYNAQAKNLLKSKDCKLLGIKPGQKWLQDRFLLPYARDNFLDHKFLVDTLETATTWGNWINLYQAIGHAIASECQNQQLYHSIWCHLSHVYRSGTSLYYTIICPQKTEALEQWQRIKHAASQAIVQNGGVISHHHGVGFDHKSYLTISECERQVWQAVKTTLDPNHIMNPGKVY